MNLQLST